MTSAEVARREHSIVSAIRAGFEVWYALLGGVAAWTIHLLLFAAWVRFTCTADGYVWVMHAATVACLAMTAAAIALSLRHLRRGDGDGDDEAAETESGRFQFLGRLGLLVGIVNVLLIGLEELYVFVLHSRRCG
jgi:hypothetical protein